MRSAYQTRYNIQAQVNRGRTTSGTKTSPTWPASAVWAAAAYAHRINAGEYLKEPEHDRDDEGNQLEGIVRYRNRDIMADALGDADLITNGDRELGLRAQQYLAQSLVIKVLKSQLTDFERALQRAVTMEQFDQRQNRIDMAIVASQIRAYEQAVQLEQVMEGVSSQPVADVGAKVDLAVTVVKSVYSQNYNVYFITAVTQDRFAVFFSYRDRLANGYQCRLRGTVKAHRENSTQLNRVRVVDQ